MHVLVLGGGVIGVSSAWYLSRAGFEVTVVDREPGPALETSFANAGQISPGYAAPWAAPGVPLKALKWLFSRDAPLVIKPGLDPCQYIWLLQMLRNCTAKRYAINKARMLRLARYSAACLNELADELGIDYEARKLGTLQLFRTQAQLEAAGGDIAVLDQYGVPYKLLDRTGILKVEPALAEVADQFTGALRLPGDQTGDCALFTRLLAERAKAAGVEFNFGATVEAIDISGDRVIRAHVDGKVVRADKYVMALGSYTPRLLAPLGIRLPVYPLKGYSLTVPIINAAKAPVSTVLDEMADYCIDFLRLTRFWLKKYPDRVMDLQYESLVADPETEVRRMLDFCGLPFDPACLEFHKTARTVQSLPSAAQVRQPIRRDTARSARYGDKLDRLRQRLREAGVLAE